MDFPEQFLWGAASAAAQIEGGWDADGRGPSIWDVLYPGHTKRNEHPHTACDHYHRYKEDVALMKQMGLKTYRFSISWSRVLPQGTGPVNEAGLAFYKNLVHELRRAGIEPMVTLYHWDLPYALHLKGGWQNPESPDWFAAYTRVVVEALSGEVRYWLTLNEPNCFVGISYVGGEHAPFLHEPAALRPVTRNVLLAHGRAVQVIRQYAKQPPQIGYAPTGPVFAPKEETAEQIEAARAETFSSGRGAFTIGWWCDPVLLGAVPADVERQVGENLFTDQEWATVRQPLDFLGFNVYHTQGSQPTGADYPANEWQGCPRTTMDWAITPECLYWSTRFLYERYGLPVLITENGMANNDFVMLDGHVHDPQRIDYIHRHLLSARRALQEGYPLIGYTYWSVMDNYEWAAGYDKRFGLVYIDYQTQARTLKDSAIWYAETIRTGGSKL